MDLRRIHQIVLESMREAVYVRDLDMNILYINPASEQLTGWSLKEAKGKKCYEIFGDEHAGCKDVCPVEKAMTEGVHLLHHEGSLKTRTGKILEMQVYVSPVSGEEGLAGAVVVMEDITRLKENETTGAKTVVALEMEIERRKQAEKELKETVSQKQAILDGITTNLAFVNENLEILVTIHLSAANYCLVEML